MKASAMSARYTSMPISHRSSRDRKSTRLNSSHLGTSYAVFCLKKQTPLHVTRPAVEDQNLLRLHASRPLTVQLSHIAVSYPGCALSAPEGRPRPAAGTYPDVRS